jgi:hypothetical protein
MALASSHTQVFTRSQGHSATAAAAYRAGEKIYDEQTGKTHDYTHRKGIAYTEIFAPMDAPLWVYDRQTLWNTVEQTETRKNSQLAREVRIALPHELTLEQNIALTREYAQTFTERGMIVDLAVHYKLDKDGAIHNPHAHLMLTMRELDGNQFSKHKCREWNDWMNVEAWRKEYERLTNSYLERAGSDKHICVDSYEKQGIEQIPTIHLGHYAHQLEQQGIPSERGDLNREIAEKNRKLAVCDQALAKADTIIQKEQEALANEKRIDEMYRRAAEARKPPPRELTPEEVLEYQKCAQQRGYHPEPRQILESELGKPGREPTADEYERLYRQTHHPRPSEQPEPRKAFRDLFGLPADKPPEQQPEHYPHPERQPKQKKPLHDFYKDDTKNHERERRERQREDERGLERYSGSQKV